MHASFQTGCHDSMDVLWVAFISLHTMKKIRHRSTTERCWGRACRLLDTLSKSRRSRVPPYRDSLHASTPSANVLSRNWNQSWCARRAITCGDHRAVVKKGRRGFGRLRIVRV